MSIVLDELTKRFGTLRVVERVSLEVADGELFVLLGASGSGKSTILRMIAGLTEVDRGRIVLNGRDVTNLAPQVRGTGFVFQNYSIFRHMSVAANIEFGLKIRKVSPAERARRSEELLDLVGLAGLGNRFSDQLSGGQRQRVALARALAYEPAVLLLDEPFGALDAKIRVQLRRSLKEIQRRLAVTTILVTHDQEEAFELGDRIGVMDRGHLLEVGDPESLYARPRTPYVATFLGSGNVIVGRVRSERAVFGPLSLPLPDDFPREEGAPVQVLVRPEQVALSEEPLLDDTLLVGRGDIIEERFAGSARRLRLALPRFPGTRQIAPLLPFGEERLLIDAVVPAERRVAQPSLWIGLRAWHVLAQPPPRFLVCDDEDGGPLDLAVHLSERMNGSLLLLGVADGSEAEAVRAGLESRTARVVRSEVKVRTGSPPEAMLAEQTSSFYDATVVSFRAGDVVRTLLERGAGPVLVHKGASQVERVLICTAAGEPGKSDVRVGGRFARRMGAPVTLLYIRVGGRPVSELVERHLRRAEATLHALDVTVEVRYREAPTPLDGILGEASELGDGLIVVGGADSRRAFGPEDITWSVVTQAAQPVLVVPAEEL